MFVPQFPVNNDTLDVFYSIKNWLDHVVNDIAELISLVEHFLSNIIEYFRFLPVGVVEVLLASFSIVGLLMIIRKGS